MGVGNATYNVNYSAFKNQVDSGALDKSLEVVLNDAQIDKLNETFKSTLSDGEISQEDIEEINDLLTQFNEVEQKVIDVLDNALSKCMEASDLTAYTQVLGNL